MAAAEAAAEAGRAVGRATISRPDNQGESMGRTIVISFEGKTARVVYASMKAGGVVVHDALVLKDGALDGFLEKEKAKEFVVVNNFRETYHDLIRIPSAHRKYHRKIIELEVRKRCQFDDFSNIYLLSGEKLVENKKFTEVFVFAVRNREIDEITDRFAAKGKTVKAVYPDIFLLSTMVDSAGKAVLCVFEAGMDKTFFLVKDGRIAFVRQARGNEPGISGFDIQNIEMTVNYCRQSLRVNPSNITLIGSLGNNYGADTVPSAPLCCLVPPSNVRAAGTVVTTALEFIVPISALNAEPYMDISPADYRGERLKRKALKYSTAAFAALSAVTLVFAGSVAGDALRARKTLSMLQAGLPDMDAAIAAYDREKAALDEYSPVIASLNKSVFPGLQGLLLAVSDIYTENITLSLISAAPSGTGLRCRIEGFIRAKDYSGAQAGYDRMIDSVGRARGLTLANNALSLKDMSFFVEADYR
ncbi:MAG: hypothetical protein Q8P48_01475 [Deltaproteobacteria bacterium]|nr:hypothetical protein [Deltaproteobacteria bacterium]